MQSFWNEMKHWEGHKTYIKFDCEFKKQMRWILSRQLDLLFYWYSGIELLHSNKSRRHVDFWMKLIILNIEIWRQWRMKKVFDEFPNGSRNVWNERKIHFDIKFLKFLLSQALSLRISYERFLKVNNTWSLSFLVSEAILCHVTCIKYEFEIRIYLLLMLACSSL